MPVAGRLPHGHDVRPDAVMVQAPPPARAAVAGLNLVGDHQAARRLDQVADGAHVFHRGRERAGGVPDGVQHQGGRAEAGAAELPDGVVHLVHITCRGARIILPVGPPVEVRRLHDRQPIGTFSRWVSFRGQLFHQGGTAVVGRLRDDDTPAARDRPGDLHRQVVGLGTRAHEHAGTEVPRQQGAEALRQQHHVLVQVAGMGVQ